MDGGLVEAKGMGYAWMVDESAGEFYSAFDVGKQLLAEAERQVRAAGDTSIIWHFAEEAAADAARALLDDAGITEIDVVYTPPILGLGRE